MTDAPAREYITRLTGLLYFFCEICSGQYRYMAKRKKKPSFFARVSSWVRWFWQFVSVDIWHITEYKLHIHILKTLNLSVRCFLNEKLQEKASALTFSSILAIVPALAMLFAICKGFGFQHIMQSQLFDYFPAQRQALEYMLSFVDQYLDQMKGGVFVGIGLCFLLWTLISLLSNIEKAFNDIWQVQGGRSFYRKVTDYTSMFLILPILMVASSGFSLFMSTMLNSSVVFEFMTPLLRWVFRLAPYILTVLFFTAIYIFIPNTKVKFKYAFISGLICGTAFQIFQYIYITGQIWVSKYNAIYGSFAFLPLLLIWMQFSWLICLFGAVLTYSSQNVVNFNFEKETNQISRRYSDYIVLVIATVIVHRFRDGLPPLTKGQISRRYAIPIQLVERTVETLEEAGVVSQTLSEEERVPAYQPAIDINKLSVGYLLRAIDREGDEDFINNLKDDFPREWRVIVDTRRLMEEEGDKIGLKDLEIEESRVELPQK